MIIKSGILVFDYTQSAPSDTWVVVHDLNKTPTCDVRIKIGGVSTKILPSSVEYTDNNTVTITFTDPQIGTARLA